MQNFFISRNNHNISKIITFGKISRNSSTTPKYDMHVPDMWISKMATMFRVICLKSPGRVINASTMTCCGLSLV